MRYPIKTQRNTIVNAKSAIVVGGGIAGCSTARALAKRGVAVTLLEQHHIIAAEASGNPIATLYPKLSTKPSPQSTLALQGFLYTLDLIKQLPLHANFFSACGQIQLAYDAREQARQDALFSQKEYAFFQALDAKEASEIAGIQLKNAGLFLPDAGWVKPRDFCQALVDVQGIHIITDSNVLNVEKNEGYWQVNYRNNSQHYELKADMVVLSNANQVQQFACLSSFSNTPLPITAVRGQVNFFAPTVASASIKTAICDTHYLSPAVNGLHSIGATYAPNDLNRQLSATDSLENLTALKHISPDIFNSIQPYKALGRVAWRSHTQDYLPLAGQLMDDKALLANPPRYNADPASLPWLQGLYVNAGHGSKGMITAPICAELIANQVCNEVFRLDPSIASKLNPSRFLLKQLGLKQLANSLYES